MYDVHHIICRTSYLYWIGQIYRAAEAVMTSTQVIAAADSPFTPAEGFVLTHFLVVKDQDRSREFYRALYGADLLSE